MVSYLISQASYSKAKNQNTMPCLRKLSSTKNHNETSDVFQLGFNKRNLTQPLRKWHRSNLTSACKSFICRQEGETEHFITKHRSPLFGQPLIDTSEVHRWISLFPNKVTLWPAIHSTCVVYTKTIIHLSVGEWWWIFTSPLRGSVNIHHYSPPLRWIIVKYKTFSDQRTFAYRAVSLWNFLDQGLQSSTSVKAFKCSLKTRMLNERDNL